MCGIWLANIIWLGCIIRGAVIGIDIQALADELNLGMPEAPLLLTPPLRGGGKRRGGRGGGAESLLFDIFLVIVVNGHQSLQSMTLELFFSYPT